MKRVRFFLVWALVAILAIPAAFAADGASESVRGHLRQQPGKAPYLETADHKQIQLTGDAPTMKVLGDGRLKDSDFEVSGHLTDPTHFEIDKIHLASLFIYRDGKRMQISYWCDVCYIRTSSPGKCWCCQKDTDLDPVEPEQH